MKFFPCLICCLLAWLPADVRGQTPNLAARRLVPPAPAARPAPAAAPAAAPVTAPVAAPVAAPAVAPLVRAVVDPWRQQQQPPGVIVVVRRGGQTEFFPFGEADVARRKPVTPDSIFELASVTKVFTTTSLAMEVEAGRMQLTDHVGKYIPFLREQGGDIRRVTLKELATHTSSLPRSPGGEPPDGEWTRQAMMQWYAQWRAPYPPGTKSLYSNIGVGLLGDVIDDFEQRPLLEVWREQFLGPLGMNSTFFEIPAAAAERVVQGYGPKGQPVPHAPVGGWPAGGRLNASGRDMAEFLVANLAERPDLPRITKAMQFAHEPYFEASPKMTQGLAWQRVMLDGELVIDKNGGLAGTSTYIGLLPRRHVGVVVMANRGKCGGTAVGRCLLLGLVNKKLPAGPEEEEQ